MSVTFLEPAMKLEDAWHKNDFAMILAIYNPKIGDEFFFQGLIFAAVEAGVLSPLPRQFNYHSNPKERNFIFRPADLRRWALSKNLIIGGLAENQSERQPLPILPSKDERDKRLQEEADRIYSNAKSKPTMKSLAQQVFNHLKEFAPEFVMDNKNKFISANTIKRIIVLPKNCKATNTV